MLCNKNQYIYMYYIYIYIIFIYYLVIRKKKKMRRRSKRRNIFFLGTRDEKGEAKFNIYERLDSENKHI